MTSTRRELIRDGAALGAAGVLAASGAGTASARRRTRRRRNRRVAILGGGVGGLTAAHELAERGFDVTVYERRAFGGKARSYGVPGTGAGGRRDLPGEHGARFIPGFYRNLPDTMRRIPFPNQADGTFGNLVTAPQESYARDGGRENFNANFAPTYPYPWTFEEFRQSLVGAFDTRFGPQEVAYFVDRLLVYFSSCDARRMQEFERTSWWDFVAAEHFSEDYRKLLISSVTRFLLGSKADEASARTLGLCWQEGVYNLMGRGSNGDYDRILNLPTNEAWIDPWVAELRRLGVKLRLGAEVEHLELRRGRVTGATIRHRGTRRAIHADWFVLAVPVERARRLLGRRFLHADPRLEGLAQLETRWMNGLQLYLRDQMPVVRGHVLYIDSPWALTSISQAQFWPARDMRRDYGDGSAGECVSIDIAAFDEPGIVFGRPARELTKPQIVRECWEQMKAHLNDTGREVLRDGQLVTWYLDPALKRRRGRGMTNADPLFISTPNAWASRPNASTKVPNLFLAADYVRVNIDTASMEGANEAGRRATNAILAAADSPKAPAAVAPLYQPPEWEPFRKADEELFRRGLPNALDSPPPPGGGPLPQVPAALSGR